MTYELNYPSVTINNIPITFVPNSIKFKRGLGETTTRTQTAGGRTVDLVYAHNIDTNKGEFSFDMISTQANIEAATSWKLNENNNVIRLSDIGFTLTFNQASLINDFEVNVGSDGTFSLEFQSKPAV